jgi:hypothetical protein
MALDAAKNSAIASFIQTTDTGPNIAVPMLEQHQYNLEAALCAFYASDRPEAQRFRAQQALAAEQAGNLADKSGRHNLAQEPRGVAATAVMLMSSAPCNCYIIAQPS